MYHHTIKKAPPVYFFLIKTKQEWNYITQLNDTNSFAGKVAVVELPALNRTLAEELEVIGVILYLFLLSLAFQSKYFSDFEIVCRFGFDE